MATDSGPLDVVFVEDSYHGKKMKAFAKTRQLTTKRDEDNTITVPGPIGHIWKYGTKRLAITFLDLTTRQWATIRRACVKTGMELQQEGDYEGTLLFDPKNTKQVRAALKVTGLKKKRKMSPEQLERLREMGTRNLNEFHKRRKALLGSRTHEDGANDPRQG